MVNNRDHYVLKNECNDIQERFEANKVTAVSEWTIYFIGTCSTSLLTPIRVQHSKQNQQEVLHPIKTSTGDRRRNYGSQITGC